MKDGKLKENQFEDVFVTELDGYSLFKEDQGKKGIFYTIYDPDMALVVTFKSFNDIEKSKNIKRSPIYLRFVEEVEKDQMYGAQVPYYDATGDDEDDVYQEPEYDDKSFRRGNTSTGFNYPKNSGRSYYYYDDDDYYYDDDYYDRNLVNPYFRGGYYKPAPKETGWVEKLNKSDTLVFHKDDPSTRMLCQVYEGKGWDVLTTSCDRIDDKELEEIFKIHDRLVFLGHGSPYGLIGMFGPEVAKYMEGKKIFAIWCNADAYFEKHGIGKGQFVTGNMPSEVWECSGAGCGKISTKLMLDNITYWSKLCADCVERCLNGDVKASVDYIRKEYLKLYGNHPVTIYNCNRTQCLGEPQPLPAFKFEGEKLGPGDEPIPGFDEEAFLKNPTEKASECPVRADYVAPAPKSFEPAKNKSSNALPYNYKQYDLFDDAEDDEPLETIPNSKPAAPKTNDVNLKDLYAAWADELKKYTYSEFFERGTDTKLHIFVALALKKYPKLSTAAAEALFINWAQHLEMSDFIPKD